MKQITILLAFLLFHITALSQIETGTENKISRLHDEIIAHHKIEFQYTWCSIPSDLYSKVDTLFKQSPREACIKYFEDTSHVLKYYSFLRILYRLQIDSLSFNNLQSCINDSSKIMIADDYEKFNQILILEYYNWLRSRYYSGYGGTLAGMSSFSFPSGIPNKKEFRRMKKELLRLMSQNNLSSKILTKRFR